MRSRSWSKAVWIAALLPLFAASVLPIHLRSLICRITGLVMAVDTSCPGESAAQERTAASGSESISEEGCCVVKAVDLDGLVAEHRSPGPPPLSPALVAAVPMVRAALAVRPTPTPRQDRPPPVGPPLVLLTRSFLI